MIDELKEELPVYNLLRQVFLKEPSPELLDGLRQSDVTQSSEDDEITRGLGMMTGAVKAYGQRLDVCIQELALEFARLFIGPTNPPAIPYASFYLSESHTLMTDETIDVRKRYLDAGMAVKDLYSIPDDHIGIELEFIYYLTQKTIELFERGEREEASRLFELRSDFLKEHMAKWLPIFTDKVIEFAQNDFYKGAALALKGIINDLV